MGLPVANPLALPIFGTASLEPSAIAFAVAGNLPGGLTGVTVHVAGGHFGSIANPTLGRSFVDSLVSGSPVVSPTLPLNSDPGFGVCVRYDPLP